MSKRKHATTPEQSASVLLSQLNEALREGRAQLAERKQVARDLDKAADRAERILASIHQGPLRATAEAALREEVERHAEAIKAATVEAKDQVMDSFQNMTSALTGIPAEVLRSKNLRFTFAAPDNGALGVVAFSAKS